MNESARRVARAAETIRARWEIGVKKDPQTEAAQVLEDTCQLQSPETAAELARLRSERAETNAALSAAVEDNALLRTRVDELEAEAYGDAKVRLFTPAEQIRHLHEAVAAQLSRANTLDRLCREQRARADELEAAVEETRPVDEDPIPYALTPASAHAVARLAEQQIAGAVLPDVTDRPEPATCYCIGPSSHRKLACSHCAMDLCEDCKTCAACPHTCNEGGAT